MNDRWDVQVVMPVAGKSHERLLQELGETLRACRPTWVHFEYDAEGNPTQLTFLRRSSQDLAHPAA